MSSAFRSEPVGALHLSVWNTPADGPDVEALHMEVAHLADQRRTPVGIVLVVERGVGLSTPSARDAAMEMVKALGDKLAAIALVIEGAGFGPAAVRGMFTGIGMIARPGFPWKMFSESDAAVAWSIDRVVEAGARTPPIIAALGRIEAMHHEV